MGGMSPSSNDEHVAKETPRRAARRAIRDYRAAWRRISGTVPPASPWDIRIKRLKVALNATLGDIAKRINLHPRTLYEIAMGHHAPRLLTVRAIQSLEWEVLGAQSEGGNDGTREREEKARA